MSTATHTFHADVYLSFYGYSVDCEIGYHMADRGTVAEKIEAVIDSVIAPALLPAMAPDGEEMINQLDETTIERLSQEAADRFRDSKAIDVFGVESI